MKYMGQMKDNLPETPQKFYKGFQFNSLPDGRIEVISPSIGGKTVMVAKNRIEAKMFVEEHGDDRLFLIMSAKKLLR